MNCCKHKYFVIFRGDDTDFPGNQELVIEIDTTRDLTGCSAHFSFQGFVQDFAKIPADRKLRLVIPNSETGKFALGAADARLWLTNGQKIRTVENKIHIVVTNRVEEAYDNDDPQAITVTISGGGGGSTVVLDDTVTAESQNGVKSSGIWSWVKSLLPRWLTSDYAEPATVASVEAKADKSALDAHVARTNNPHAVTAMQIGAYTKEEVDTKVDGKLDKQYGNMSISWDDFYYHLNIKNAILNFSLDSLGVSSGIIIGGNKLYSDEWYLSSTLNIYYKIKLLTGAQLTFLDNKGNEESIEDRIKRISSLAPEYSTSSAYTVGQYVFHDGSIYRCTTAIALPGEAWNPAHWSEAQKLDDFFTDSNSLLTATIDARLPYPLYAVPSTGLLKDRAINTTSLDAVTVPDNFTDLLVRASVASSLSVTMPEAIATKYGDTFPGEAGEYLITITKTGAAEAYVRTIKLEEVA